jgi:hypothetical protein
MTVEQAIEYALQEATSCVLTDDHGAVPVKEIRLAVETDRESTKRAE